MSGKFLLDTNILIALFSGDTSVQVHLKNANEVFISSTVLGELYFGARKSHHIKKNLAHIDEFASNITVLSCDSNTARKYGLINSEIESEKLHEYSEKLMEKIREKGITILVPEIVLPEISSAIARGSNNSEKALSL